MFSYRIVHACMHGLIKLNTVMDDLCHPHVKSSVCMQYIIGGEPEQAPNTRVIYSEFTVPMYVCMYVSTYVTFHEETKHNVLDINLRYRLK